MKRKRINLTKGILVTILWSFFLSVSAQNINVKGVVTDDSGDKLIGVTVQIQGTSLGTITDIDGEFNLTNVPNDGVLEVSYVGMRPLTVNVDGRSSYSYNYATRYRVT